MCSSGVEGQQWCGGAAGTAGGRGVLFCPSTCRARADCDLSVDLWRETVNLCVSARIVYVAINTNYVVGLFRLSRVYAS